MSKIIRIFYDDLKSIFTNFALLIIIIALAILPSLYAWFNIYASWDPYGNTSNIPIAVINNDTGTTLRDKKINMGDKLVENLKDNDSLGWRFVSSDEAKSGVESGKYYASLEIPKDFSKNLTSIVSGKITKAKIIYTVNEKINAIAPKITNTGASTIRTEVNQNVVKAISEVAFSVLNDAGIELQEHLPKLAELENSLIDVQKRFSNIDDTLNSATDALSKMSIIVSNLDKNMPLIEETLSNYENLTSNIGSFLEQTQGDLKDLEPIIKRDLQILNSLSASASDLTVNLIDTITNNKDEALQILQSLNPKIDTLYKVSTSLYNLLDSINKNYPNVNLDNSVNRLKSINEKLSSVIKITSTVEDQLNSGKTPSVDGLNNLLTVLNDVNSITSSILNNYDAEIKKPISNIITTGIEAAKNTNQLVKNAQDQIPNIKELLTSLTNFSTNAENTVELVDEKVPKAKAILKNFISALYKVNNSADTQELIDFLKNNSVTSSDFLESPAEIVDKVLYPMGNYGASMTPFYTTLSLWVGVVLLTSLLTTHVEGDYKPWQVYLGRGLTFLIISILQALIVSLGDLFLLGIKMKNPVLFVLISILISTVFNFIVYSLVSIFGNIGKGIAIILLVLQVGGSGGVFPIEVTPTFFQNLYPFLPFTYSISALRECIGGIYSPNLTKDISILFIYLISFVLLNIFLKAPINRFLHKFSDKLEDSRLTE